MFGRFANNGESKVEQPATPVVPVAVLGSKPKVSALEETETVQHEYSTRYIELKVQLHQSLLDMMNLSSLDKMKPEEIRAEVEDMVRDLLREEQTPVSMAERNQLIPDILDEVLGLGPLEPLLKDPTITDILVNTHEHCFVERRGRLEQTSVRFKDEKHLLRIIKRIVSGVGRRVDESQPTVDARLLDGSRVNAVISPIAVDGTLLSIRKFSKIPFTIESLIENEAITPEIAELLAAIVKCRLNVLISGGTGSGKTTMLNAMSCNIANNERIITIEDAAELQLQQIHVARMETRPVKLHEN